MKNYIRKKMEEIHRDFLYSIEPMNRLCSLIDLRFNNGHIPDYHDALVQQLYLLRYYPAYLIEYFDLYNRFIDLEFLIYNWKVLSLGCGCGVDYHGMYFALTEKNLEFTNQDHYTGIDKIQWGYAHDLVHDNVEFLYENILNRQRFNRGDYNIIIFPKSIGEFSNSQLSQLNDILRNTPFNENRIAILASLRESNLYQDSRALQVVINAFTRMGFSVRGYIDYCGPPNQALITLFPKHFYYPDEVKETLKNLSTRCQEYLYCLEDCSDLNRHPILRANHIRNQIYCLERNDFPAIEIDDEIPF